ncbi:HD domain-containing protein [Candidatus Beckwithbacteria bacterium]|nr:HD domain-containing protein [Candidatus Beckwithbacteria bacterium]
MQYLDPLYGQLEIDEREWQLFQTQALTRIRDISLSAVPPVATASGMVGSRFEHSVGVAYLAKILTMQNDFKHLAADLYLASLFHDIGSPPFSHITEKFMEEITGESHEVFASQMLYAEDSQKAIKNYGGNLDHIYKLIIGETKPWSDLINGSIDLDNIDNSLRWGLATGIFNHKFYEPEDIIQAYVWANNQLSLKLNFYPHIQKWELCRRLIYDVVYSNLNLIPESMLFRALQFAYEDNELKKDFFSFTDSQALYFLEYKANQLTRKLMKDMRFWHLYLPAGKIIKADTISETVKTFCTVWQERQKIADIIAHSLGVKKEEVTVYAGKDRGFKKIHLPFIGDGEIVEHQPLQKLFWRIKVFLHPKHKDKVPAVQELLESIVG